MPKGNMWSSVPLPRCFCFNLFFVNFWCKQGSGPEGGDVLVFWIGYSWGLAAFIWSLTWSNIFSDDQGLAHLDLGIPDTNPHPRTLTGGLNGSHKWLAGYTWGVAGDPHWLDLRPLSKTDERTNRRTNRRTCLDESKNALKHLTKVMWEIINTIQKNFICLCGLDKKNTFDEWSLIWAKKE